MAHPAALQRRWHALERGGLQPFAPSAPRVGQRLLRSPVSARGLPQQVKTPMEDKSSSCLHPRIDEGIFCSWAKSPMVLVECPWSPLEGHDLQVGDGRRELRGAERFRHITIYAPRKTALTIPCHGMRSHG